jgi:hypothetical protein
MNILCVFVGQLRLDLNTLIRNINIFKKNFENTDINIQYLYFINGTNFNYYDYDYSAKELFNHAHVIYAEEETTVVSKNKRSVISCLYNKYIQQHIRSNNLDIDYVIKIRNDLYIDINHIKKYFDNSTVVAPRYWHNSIKNKDCCGNNHFYIIPYTKFMNLDFSDDMIFKLAKKCYDTEEIDWYLFTPNKVIDLNDINEYILNGSFKFHIKNNKIISMSQDYAYSLII